MLINWRHCAALVFTLVLGYTQVCSASPSYKEKAAELHRLRQRIKQVEQGLDAQKGRRDDVSDQLRDLDTRIGKAAEKLKNLDAAYEKKQDNIKVLRKQVAVERRRLTVQRQRLKSQLVASYMMGGQPYLKLLLNQQDPESVERIVTYYDYLDRARGAEIQQAQGKLQHLAELREALAKQLDEVARTRQEQTTEQQSLRSARKQRATLLARIDKSISRKGDALARLKKNEKRLTDLVNRLQRALADIPDKALDDRPFIARKGHLKWPVAGRVIARYGASRGAGDIRWTGVIISAKEGAPVRAISHGRVVFANWLRGLGLLMIVDHGHGYMTLYGHNETLYKQTGDWVQPGDIIATVGASGGPWPEGLYFEVRANGKPENPLRWLKPAGKG